MKNINYLEVWMNDRQVGTLAQNREGKVMFEYDESWILKGYSISPLSLPLEKKVFEPKMEPFEGMFGVFNDSLPDGWGRILVNRMLLKEHVNLHEITPLMRLAIVGDSGMGALKYKPMQKFNKEENVYDLDRLADECTKLLNQEYVEELDKLFALGGSSGGARPKILTKFNNEEWIIKFPSTFDNKEIGIEEYEYAECATKCGIEVEETKLFQSKKCCGYFGVRRFDRIGKKMPKKVHMITVSGLLETSHRIPNLDYHTLMKLTWIMTKESKQIEQMYRRMCFNVFAHNRDDHSNNFSFIFNEQEEKWQLSPAYDLTYSNSLRGEHATCVDGNGLNPGMKELLAVGVRAGMTEEKSKRIANDIKDIVTNMLEEYLVQD